MPEGAASEAAETQTETAKAPPKEGSPGGETPGAKETPSSPPARPDSIPEKFWDAEKGAVKTDDLINSHRELEGWKASVESLGAQVPEKPDGYKLELPKDVELPEGLEFKPNPDDPRVAPLREWAHKHRIPQDALSELYGVEAQAAIQSFKADKEFAEAEMQKLGEKGPERVKAVEAWIDAVAGDKDAAQAGKDLLSFSDGVKLFENLMKLQAGPTAVRSGAEGASGKDISGESLDDRLGSIGSKAMQKAGVKW